MRCLILGGGGFIGSFLADRLLAHGHAVRIFERPRVLPHRAFGPKERVEWTTGDFQSTGDLQAAVQGSDAVFHLVSTTLPKGSNDDPIYDVETNLVGTLRLLAAAVRCGVTKVLFISSGGTVYGIPNRIPVSEDHPTDPLVSYGIAKLAIEKYLYLYWYLHGLDYCCPAGRKSLWRTTTGRHGTGCSSRFPHQGASGHADRYLGRRQRDTRLRLHRGRR